MTRPSGAIPGPAHRAELDAALHVTGADSGFRDDHGRPAPWPEDIDEWRPSTNESVKLAPGEQPF
jgi:hypothetical protein